MPEVIPVFAALLMRHDITRVDAMLYGLIVAVHKNGAPTTVVQIAAYFGIDERHVWARLTKLEQAGLIRRDRRAMKIPGRRGAVTRLVPLGPTEETQ